MPVGVQNLSRHKQRVVRRCQKQIGSPRDAQLGNGHVGRNAGKKIFQTINLGTLTRRRRDSISKDHALQSREEQ